MHQLLREGQDGRGLEFHCPYLILSLAGRAGNGRISVLNIWSKRCLERIVPGSGRTNALCRTWSPKLGSPTEDYGFLGGLWMQVFPEIRLE